MHCLYFGIPAKPGIAKADDIDRKAVADFIDLLLVDLFVLLFVFSQVNSYGHAGTVSSPNHTFFPGQA